jgi:Tol biopolymer transport system component
VALSPNGTRVATTRDDAQNNADLWLHDVARNTSTRFTSAPAVDYLPVWSPDSTRVLFSSARGGGGLYEKDANSATEEKLLLKAMPGEQLDANSFDGRHLLYTVRGPKGSDLRVLSIGGEPKPAPFLATEFDERCGQFSPDGRWVAYQSNESGRSEIYVRGFPQTSGQWPISVAGGKQPRWRRDGREIYYVAPDNKLMAVEVKPSGAAIEVGSPRGLFTVKLGGFVDFSRDYDVTPDGKRFLVNSLIEGAATPITLVLNWKRKLKKP